MARTCSAGNNFVNTSAVRTATPLTLACWFKPVNNTTSEVLVVIDNNVSGQSRFQLAKINDGTLQATTATDAASSGASTVATYSAGVWQHACGVFASATDRRIFLNGANKQTNAVSRVPSGLNRTRIGYRAGPLVEYNGDIGECAIWSVALSDSEVAQLGAGAVPNSIQRTSIVAYWVLAGTASPEPDFLNTFPMTLNGSPTVASTDPPIVRYRPIVRSGLYRRHMGW